MQIIAVGCMSRDPSCARETDAWGIARAPIPRPCSSWASIAAAASSSTPRPATHNTAPGIRHSGAIGLPDTDHRLLPASRAGEPLWRGKIADQLHRRAFQPLDLRRGQRPSGDVVGSQLQPLQHDLVVIGQERLLRQVALGLLLDLVRIVRQHPLIKTRLRAQDRTVAEHHVEEFEVLDVPSRARPGTASAGSK